MNNPKTRQQWIYDLLKSEPDLLYGDVFTKYLQKFTKLSRQTFTKDWNIAKQRHQDYQQKLQKEKEAISIKEDLEPLKRGLKTKNDRLITLQKQIDATERELEIGTFTEIKRDGDKALKFERPLTPYEKAMMRRTIKHLQSEISKIEGDYAPTKVDHSTLGKSLNTSNVNWEDAPTELLEEIKKFRDTHKNES